MMLGASQQALLLLQFLLQVQPNFPGCQNESFPLHDATVLVLLTATETQTVQGAEENL